MAHLNARRSQNIDGDFYVDSSCIDCDTCRWMAPSVFTEVDGMSAVYHQPSAEFERLAALQALLSCPTASIGTVEKPQDIQQAQKQIPIPIAENIFHCGYHSEKSYAAASYLIQSPAGNILIDSPRFTPPLVKRLEEMGGVRYMLLTHRDDVADHQKFHDHFKCDRLLHVDEINSGTKDVEIIISDRDTSQIIPDIEIIPVPGHTKGHLVFLYRDRFLFTGDHLAYSPRLGHIYAFRTACWYSWPELVKSFAKLLDYQFTWILPGHGRRWHADSPAAMKQSMQQGLTWAQTQ